MTIEERQTVEGKEAGGHLTKTRSGSQRARFRTSLQACCLIFGQGFGNPSLNTSEAVKVRGLLWRCFVDGQSDFKASPEAWFANDHDLSLMARDDAVRSRQP